MASEVSGHLFPRLGRQGALEIRLAHSNAVYVTSQTPANIEPGTLCTVTTLPQPSTASPCVTWRSRYRARLGVLAITDSPKHCNAETPPKYAALCMGAANSRSDCIASPDQRMIDSRSSQPKFNRLRRSDALTLTNACLWFVQI